MRGFLSVVSFAVLLVSASAAHTRAFAYASSRIEEVAEGEIAGRINELRAQYTPQADRLLYDPALVQIARVRAHVLADRPRREHDGGDQRHSENHMAIEGGARIGENLFVEGRSTRRFDAAGFASRAVDEWITSPERRASILSPHSIATGIGVVVTRDRAYVVQVFR